MGQSARRTYTYDINLEDTKKVSINSLLNSGLLREGARGQLSWLVDGNSDGAIGVQGGETSVTLSYRYKGYDGSWEPVTQTVEILQPASGEHFRSARFKCPNCGEAVSTLSGYGCHFLCRHCYQFPFGSFRGKAGRYGKQAGSQPDYSSLSDRRRSPRNQDNKHCHLVVEVIPTPMMDQVGQASDRASSRA